MEEVEVSEASWQSRAGGEAGDGEVDVTFDDGTREGFDRVWLATGGNLDLSLVPILASLQAQRPIKCAGGLPMLQPDLAWDAGCPCYVMGAFAGLQLGADALNLAGARSGGVLVARALLAETTPGEGGVRSESGTQATPPRPPAGVTAVTEVPSEVPLVA